MFYFCPKCFYVRLNLSEVLTPLKFPTKFDDTAAYTTLIILLVSAAYVNVTINVLFVLINFLLYKNQSSFEGNENALKNNITCGRDPLG